MRASMSPFLPTPPTIVVFSLSIDTFLARPSMLIVTFSSLMPRSSLIAWPPVRTAMSCSMALRRSPKPGAFTAAELVDHERGKRLAFHVLGDDEQRLAGLHHGLEQREQLLETRELLLVDQDVGVFELDPHLVGVGDEVRRDVAAVELHALDDLEPSLTIAWARTVAVVVPSPAKSEDFEATSRTIWAPMFSNLSSSSISLATVTPSLVMRGAPNDLSRTTLRPFGPSVTLTALARMSTPRSILSRASTENLTSLAAISIHSVDESLILRSRARRVRPRTRSGLVVTRPSSWPPARRSRP